MTAELIIGKDLSQKVRDEIKSQISTNKIKPGLAVIQVGTVEASTIYVNKKKKQAQEAGMYAEVHRLAEKTTTDDLVKLIRMLNKDKKIHGFIVQKPLPKHIDEAAVDSEISPEKDVDGLCPINAAALYMGKNGFVPATPKGVMRLLEENNVEVNGKHVVVIGRSLLVGKPLAMLMLNKNATVTICHSRSKGLAGITKTADIVCIAIGIPKFLKSDMLKTGCIVVDIGINRLADGSIVGDVDFDSCNRKASKITPVPGGVGPMTIAMLLENTLLAYKSSIK